MWQVSDTWCRRCLKQLKVSWFSYQSRSLGCVTALQASIFSITILPEFLHVTLPWALLTPSLPPPSPFNSTLPPVCLTDTLHINRSEKKKKKPITSLPLKSLLPQSIFQTFPASFPSLLFSAPLLCSVDFLSSGHNIQTVKSLGAHTPSLLTHMSSFPLPSLHHLLNFHTNIQ